MVGISPKLSLVLNLESCNPEESLLDIQLLNNKKKEDPDLTEPIQFHINQTKSEDGPEP